MSGLKRRWGFTVRSKRGTPPPKTISAYAPTCRHSCLHFRSAIGCCRNKYLRCQACSLLISTSHSLSKTGHRVCLHQVDGAATETTARHAGAINAFLLHRQLDHQVQLCATNFVIVSEAIVRVAHQAPEGTQISAQQRGGCPRYPLILTDHMTAAAV